MANTQAIDHVLRQAVTAHDVPGVVAMAATDQGVMYEGAFGTRELGQEAAMTPDTVVCYVSAMKLNNEVRAGVSGTIVEVVAKNDEFVDYGTVLFRVDPS